MIKPDRDRKYMYFVMEKCDKNLDEAVKEFGGKRTAFPARKVLLDVAKGVAHLHKNKYVHKDIKPSNILLKFNAGSVVAKVADFGLSVVLDHTSATMTGSGTDGWSAPERDTAQQEEKSLVRLHFVTCVCASIFLDTQI
eukprot:m.248697 g.248697  ORF g.248697 m.248697 type:complete len:139 (+) comp40291_c1_seq3:2130-2546(+)